MLWERSPEYFGNGLIDVVGIVPSRFWERSPEYFGNSPIEIAGNSLKRTRKRDFSPDIKEKISQATIGNYLKSPDCS